MQKKRGDGIDFWPYYSNSQRFMNMKHWRFPDWKRSEKSP